MSCDPVHWRNLTEDLTKWEGAIAARLHGIVSRVRLDILPALQSDGAGAKAGSDSSTMSKWLARIDVSPSPFFVRVCLVMLLTFLVSASWSLVAAWRASPPPPRALASLIVLTAAALLVRVLLSPRTFLHEYYHVGDQVELDLFGGSGIFFYGATGPALYGIVNALLGGDEKAIFGTNLVISSLTIPAVTLLDLVLFRQWPRALVAGFIFCLLPQHLRFSASEELAVLETFFAVSSLAAFVDYCRTFRLASLAVAVSGLTLAVNARPEGALLPVIAAAYLLATRKPREWRAFLRPGSLIGFGFVAMILVGRFRTMPPGPSHFTSLRELVEAAPFRRFDLIGFIDPGVTPRGLVVLAVLGLIWGVWRKATGATVWLLLSATAYLLILSLFENPPPSNLRLQLITLPFAAILCAGAWSLLAELMRGWHLAPALLTGAVGVLMVSGVLSRRDMLGATADLQQEWEFLRDSVSRLPSDGELLTLDHGYLPGSTTQGKVDVFPQFLLNRSGSRLRIVDLDTLLETQAWPAPHPGLVYYQGMFCYFYFPPYESAPQVMNRRCLEVHRRYELRPIATAKIPGPGYCQLSYLPPPYEIGFFEIIGSKVTSP